MDAQLRLIPRPQALPQDATPAHEAAEAPSAWRIDDTTRERGRAGIARARDALRHARRPLPGDRHSTAA